MAGGSHVAVLRIYYSSDDHTQSYTDYNIYPGETIIGRKKDVCQLALPLSSLSRKHCCILIEEDEHFIMDLASQNKTYRRKHCLRPHTYYELVDNIELTLANISCRYYCQTSPPADKEYSKSTNPASSHLLLSDNDNTPDIFLLNEKLSDVTDDTATPSPKPKLLHSPSPHSPNLLTKEPPQFIPDNEDSMECYSPQLLAGIAGASPTVPYNKDNEGDISNDFIDNDQTLPYDVPDKTIPYELNEGSNDETRNGSREGSNIDNDDQTLPHDISDKTIPYDLNEGTEDNNDDQTLPYDSHIPDKTTHYQTDNKDNEEIAQVSLMSVDATTEKEQNSVCDIGLEPTVQYDASEQDKDDTTHSPPTSCHEDSLEPTIAYVLKEEETKTDVDKPDIEATSVYNLGGTALEDENEKKDEVSSEDSAITRLHTRKRKPPAIFDNSSQETEDEIKTKRTRKKVVCKEVPFSSKKAKEGVDKELEPIVSCQDNDNRSSTSKINESIQSVESTLVADGEQEEKVEPKQLSKKRTRSNTRQIKTKSVSQSDVTTRHSTRLKREPTTSLLVIEESPVKEQSTLTSEVPTHETVIKEDSTSLPEESIVSKEKTASHEEFNTNENISALSVIPTSAKKTRRGQKRSIKESSISLEKVQVGSATPTSTMFSDESPDIEASTGEKGSVSSSLMSTPEPKTKKARLSRKTTESKSKVRAIPRRSASVIASPLKSSLEKSPKVMFTGVIDEEGTEIVKELGGTLVESVSQCTHLVTDKVRRTVKFLCCLGRGCDIVSTEWLAHCRQERQFIPPKPFIIHDRPAERQYQFSLAESINKARGSPLLKDWSIYMTDNIKPCPMEMKEIINSAGGEVLTICPTMPNDTEFIISCESDLSLCQESLSAGVTICSNEAILTGILKQKLELSKYVLNDKKRKTTSAAKSIAKKRR